MRGGCYRELQLRVKAAAPLGKRGPLPSCGWPALLGDSFCWIQHILCRCEVALNASLPYSCSLSFPYSNTVPIRVTLRNDTAIAMQCWAVSRFIELGGCFHSINGQDGNTLYLRENSKISKSKPNESMELTLPCLLVANCRRKGAMRVSYPIPAYRQYSPCISLFRNVSSS